MFQTVWCYLTVASLIVASLCGYVATRRRFRATKTVVGTALAAMLIAVAGVMLFVAQRGAALQRIEMRHLVDVMRVVTRVDSAVAHAEAGQRGYLLTMDPRYLAAFVQAKGRVGEEVGDLATLLADDPVLAPRGKTLASLVQAEVADLDSTLVGPGEANRERGLAIVRAGGGGAA